jgi:hypothetical protein
MIFSINFWIRRVVKLEVKKSQTNYNLDYNGSRSKLVIWLYYLTCWWCFLMDQPFFLLLLSFIPVIIYALMSPAAGSCLEGKERGGGKKNDEANWFIIRRLAERTEETGGTMVGSSLEWRRIRLWYRWANSAVGPGPGPITLLWSFGPQYILYSYHTI